MAMRRACGFEAGSIDVADFVYGATVTNAISRTGSYSLDCRGIGSDRVLFNTRVDSEPNWYIQAAFWLAKPPGTWASERLYFLQHANLADVAEVAGR